MSISALRTPVDPSVDHALRSIVTGASVEETCATDLAAGPWNFDTVPGYGGTVGLGYEWTVKKTAGIGLGADFDGRMITRHESRQSFTVGLHFHFH